MCALGKSITITASVMNSKSSVKEWLTKNKASTKHLLKNS